MTFTERIREREDARDLLQTMIDALIPIRDFLADYNDLLDLSPESITRETLSTMSITLTVEGENLSIENWTPERLAEAYNAVMAIVNRIASDADIDQVLALLTFIEVFGGVEIRLFEGNFGDESYASTSDDGNIIYLYTQPTAFLEVDLERCGQLLGIEDPLYNDCVGYDFTVHSDRNIVHEFGHVLAFRHNELFAEWEVLRSLISNFDTPLGWLSDDFELLQNQSTMNTQPDGVVLENERIANMFEAWVYGREPDLDGLFVPEDQSIDRQIRAAWAMWLFMTGTIPPSDVMIRLFGREEDQPCYDETQPCARGFLEWILEFGGL